MSRMFNRVVKRREPTKDNLLSRGIRATRPAFATAIVFSFFINILAFVGPLYMLQIYDRVLGSRNEWTLLFLTVIAGFLLLVYAWLEKVRSAVLVRTGILFDSKTRSELFESVLLGTLKQPNLSHHTILRELDVIREFLTGAGLISFCDAPWVPIFVAGCFILHPWYGWISLVGAALIFSFAVANELSNPETAQGRVNKRKSCRHVCGGDVPQCGSVACHGDVAAVAHSMAATP